MKGNKHVCTYACMQVMLFGARNIFEGDKLMQITLAFNHFGQGLVQIKGCQGADMGLSMLTPTTTLIGSCMPLVVAKILPFLARETGLSLLPSQLQRR